MIDMLPGNDGTGGNGCEHGFPDFRVGLLGDSLREVEVIPADESCS